MISMNDGLRYVGQAVLYAGFIAVLGYLSTEPPYQFLSADQAVIKLTINHAGKIKGECRKPTAEETEGYPRNMIPPEICPRERAPVRLSMSMDGKDLYEGVLSPSGLRHDGSSTAYQRFNVPAGEHELDIRMNDDIRVKGHTHQKRITVNLAPAQVLVVNFDNAQNHFLVQ
ncbi:MAG: hypothetical protein IME93_01380 [Proteobacteria bacterium]|nr:hypothetical protein [Pseudomonadota bacterium]